MPRMPWATASGGYLGLTSLTFFGTGTPSLPTASGGSSALSGTVHAKQEASRTAATSRARFMGRV